MIVVATSGVNHCLYCVVAHGAILRIYAKNPQIADQVAIDHRKADITPRQKAMLDFAVKLARTPEAVTEADYQSLREHGFSEEDIWDIGGITAFFALSNRMAHLIAMRPNDEFYLLGRVPPPKRRSDAPATAARRGISRRAACRWYTFRGNVRACITNLHQPSKSATQPHEGHPCTWLLCRTSIHKRPRNGWRRWTACSKYEGPQRAHYILEKLIEKARRSGAYLPYNATTAYINTHPARPGGALARRPRAGAPHPLLRALERDGDGGARQQGVLGARRPHRQLRLGRDPVRRRLQSLLARAERRPRRRPGLLPGPFLPGHLRARLPGRPHQRGAAGQLPPGSGRQGPVLLSASLADARTSGSSRPCPWAWGRSWRSTRRAS